MNLRKCPFPFPPLPSFRSFVPSCFRSRWYIDPISDTVHLSGVPSLCVTGYDASTLYGPPTTDFTGGTFGRSYSGTTFGGGSTLAMLSCTSCALGSESRTGGPLLDAPYLSSVLNLTLGMPRAISFLLCNRFSFFCAISLRLCTAQTAVEGSTLRRPLTTRRWRCPGGCLERARPLLW